MNIINKVTGQFSQVITYDSVTGEITGFNPIGNVNLGPVSNLSITGGTSGQVLATDGAGGLSFVTAPGGSYSNVDVSNYLAGNIATNIIPATATQSLGSLANPWNELYVSGNTIFVAGVPLSLGANTALEFNGVPLVAATGDTNIQTSGNIQASAIEAEGNITANTGFFFIGDGGLLSNISGTGSYSNANVEAYLPTYTGNLAGGNATITQQVTAGSFLGDGGNLSNVTAANVVGTVASATVAASANSVAGANVSGTVASATVAASANSVAGANVVGTVASATVAASANSVAGANVTGEVSFATTANTVAGANVTGTVANATFATTAAQATNALTAAVATVAHSVDGANVSGAVAFATTANSVAAANVIGTVANANYSAYAGNVTLAAQPNITSVGTLTSLTVSGNASAGNTAAGNLLTANFITGTLTTAAQPNITSVGTLLDLTVQGNATVDGNVITDDIISRTGDITISASGTDQNVVLAPSGTGYVDVNSALIKNLSDPVDAQDAATKGYVDATATGLSIQDPCVVATNNDLATITGGTVTYDNGTAGVGATLTLSAALASLDGVTLTAGDRILVKNEINQAYNGIYTWATGGLVLTRATDFDTTVDIIPGDFVFISSGTQYDSTGWVQTDTVATIGTDAITFSQFSGSGAYTAGTGLTLSGTQFSLTNTTVTAGTYGNATHVVTQTVNGQGQITSISQQEVIANAETLSGTVLKNTVLTSNLTSVGTLVGLVINGNLEVTQSAQIQGNAAVLGNLFAAHFNGEGGNLSNVTAANITGTIANANYAAYAGNVTIAAQPNITSVGTLVDLTVNSSNTVSITGGNTTSIVLDSANGYVSVNQNANIDIYGNITTPSDVTAFNMFAESMIADVMGNATTVLFGDGANITGLPPGYANSDVANLLASGTLTSNIVTSGNIFGGYINGDGSGLTLLTGSEVTGEVTFAATANTVAGANVTGAVTFAATANAVAGANVSGTVASATVAASANSVAGANVSGEVAFAAVANSVAGANVSGVVANANYAAFSGQVVDSAQANITSVGTLTALEVVGITDLVDLNASGQVVLNGVTITETQLTTTGGGFEILGTDQGVQLQSLDTANSTFALVFADNTGVGLVTDAGEIIVGLDGNVTVTDSMSVGGELSTAGNLTATGDIGSSGNIVAVGNVQGAFILGDGSQLTGLPAGYSNTDVSTYLASGLNVDGYITSGPIVAAEFAGNGAQLYDIAGANVTGTVANATFATTAGTADSVDGANVTGQVANALVAGTVYTAAQLNITSVGTLTALAVSGNTNVGGNLVTDTVISNTGSLSLQATGTNQSVTLVPTGTGVVDVSGFRVTDLATPVSSTDATTKAYVDSVAEGLNVKEGCVAATPADLATLTGDIVSYNNGTAGVGATLTLDTALTTLDGVTLANGDRILVKSEASTEWNGIYVWATGGTVLTRSTDYDTPADISAGSFVFISSGTLYAGTGWVETDAVTTIGTSPIDFTQFSGAGSYTAGAGLTLAGTQFSVTDTTVTAGTYGNAGQTTTFTVNSRGQLTAASQQAVVANAETLSGTTLNSTVVASSLTSVGTLTGLTVSGVSNLSAVGNVIITGGTSGQALTTDGAGNLAWATISSIPDAIANGTSNLSIPVADGNITGYVGGIKAFNIVGIDATSNLGVSMGYSTNTGNYGVSIGYFSGFSGQGEAAVAVGPGTGTWGQGERAVAIGENAGVGSIFGAKQGANSIAIGANAGQNGQSANSIILNATGAAQGADNSGFYVNPVRNDTGNTTNAVYFNTTTKEVTYGPVSGGSYGDSNVVTLLGAFGSNTVTTTGNVTAGNFELTGNITKGAGYSIQLNPTNFVVGINQAAVVAINPDEDTGYIALGTTVLGGGAQTIAIGSSAQSQAGGAGSISIGYKAAPFSPGAKSIAIGQFAGFGSFVGTKLGANTIAIGYGAANGGSAANVIVLNATGANFTPSTSQASSFYVNPVRNDTGNVTNVMYYNTTTKEVTYGPTAYSNANVSTYLAGNTDTAGYFTTGNISAGNIGATGNISANGNIVVNGTIGTGNISGANNISGLTLLASNAILVGANVTTLPNTVARFGSNSNSYTQITFQNLSTGTDATSDIVLTTDNGNDTVNFADFGIINSAYDPLTPTNSLGNVVFAGDAYLYAQGNVGNTAQSGGNLVLGATVSTKNVKIFAGGNTNAFVTATFTSTAANLKALIVQGTSNLGAVGNVTITGGTAGQVLTTNGSNVLSWTTVSGGGGTPTSIVNGTSNVSIASSDGNITMAVNGNSAFRLSDSGIVSIGVAAQGVSSNTGGIAIGYQAGFGGQLSSGAIALGWNTAFQVAQQANAIAIGSFAGFGNIFGSLSQGANSIAIGSNAARNGSAAGTIILNATGANVSGVSGQANSFYVAPVRNDTGNVTNVMYYNTTTNEVTYGPAGGGGGGSTGIDRSVITGNVTLTLAQAGTFLYSTAATAESVTIPPNESVEFPIGTTINVVLNGAGSVVLTPASGVSLYLAGNSTSATRTVSPYGLATLLQVDTNVWFVNGTGVY